ncbi:hypothetical protein BBK36DRAFT_1121320 [Trichoderma citrinoviride]|uniref:BTB domain-containing protein n=1 Tax=Trichoderma citrinoviride TaxID=58853 RepID=A0A2T4B9B6_9HYPO|nr:hypothetical protein BBK36DRAFT_1121320 [Trichoderma citrinoviride]PTB65914.1 hypothetical protein BBK36DRAFT_1121320 [Trichoderma citrinoviride]
MGPTLGSHAQNLCILMASAQKKRELCDLELVCNGQTITVHKLVACLQSPVIKAACTGSFKEASGKYEMKDCEFANVQRMVDFFYKGDYDGKTDNLEAVQDMLIHVAMFTLADMYLIDGLRTLSETKFTQAVKKLKEPGVIPQYVKPVYDLQAECSKSLRDVVIETVRLRITELPFGLDIKQILDGLMGEVPEFAKDLAMSYIQQPQYTTGLFAPSSDKKNPATAASKCMFGRTTAFDEAIDKDGNIKSLFGSVASTRKD